MAGSLSPIEQFAPEILECIAFHTAVDRNFVPGPPRHLIPLLCTSRTINDTLSFKNNSHLYADIFHVKFDYTAPIRRLGIGWLTSPCLSSELRKRFAALKRIKCRNHAHVDDMWTAYLLMIENDGRNEAQLIEWAEFREFLMAVLLLRARAPPGSWFTGNQGTALLVWLLWLTDSQCERRLLYVRIC